MTRCRKCGAEVFPRTRCRPCAEKWMDNRVAAFNQTKAEGYVMGSPAFTRRLHKLEKELAKAKAPAPLEGAG